MFTKKKVDNTQKKSTISLRPSETSSFPKESLTRSEYHRIASQVFIDSALDTECFVVAYPEYECDETVLTNIEHSSDAYVIVFDLGFRSHKIMPTVLVRYAKRVREITKVDVNEAMKKTFHHRPGYSEMLRLHLAAYLKW